MIPTAEQISAIRAENAAILGVLSTCKFFNVWNRVTKRGYGLAYMYYMGKKSKLFVKVTKSKIEIGKYVEEKKRDNCYYRFTIDKKSIVNFTFLLLKLTNR